MSTILKSFLNSMEKKFDNKKVRIREINNGDLKIVKEFRDFMNSLVDDNAKILKIEKVNLKEEREWMVSVLKAIKSKREVYVFAEHNGKVVGASNVKQYSGRQNHVGLFGIAIRDGYRGIGLGEYLAKQVIALAKKRFKPSPKFIRLDVLSNNEPAQGLYNKIGFKEVARIPEQLQYNGKLVDELIMLLKI